MMTVSNKTVEKLLANACSSTPEGVAKGVDDNEKSRDLRFFVGMARPLCTTSSRAQPAGRKEEIKSQARANQHATRI
jgi:hypothetical protein